MECSHVWRDAYGGSECVYCGLFYPSGGAPWDVPIEDTDDTPRGTCEVCGGEWGDGWSSCQCEDEDEDDFDCGWVRGQGCTKAGSEECDWECPHRSAFERGMRLTQARLAKRARNVS